MNKSSKRTTLSNPHTKGQGYGNVVKSGESVTVEEAISLILGDGHGKIMLASMIGSIASAAFVSNVSSYEIIILMLLQYGSTIFAEFIWNNLSS